MQATTSTTTSTGRLVSRLIAGLMALTALCSLAALNAHGMEPLTSSQFANRGANASDWWSPERAPTPHSSLLALADPRTMVLSASDRISRAEYPVSATDTCEKSQYGCGYSSKLESQMMRGVELPLAANQGPVDFADTYAEETGFGRWISNVSLRYQVMLRLLHANYGQWESELAETHPAMRVNGGSVYAFAQLNAAGASLPIGMYVMPLRGAVGELR